MQITRAGTLFLLCCFDLCFASSFQRFSFNKQELEHYRLETRNLFYHGYDNYMQLAYPHDELYPIKCCERTRNFQDEADVVRNDAMGNYSSTMVDSLTTLAILGDKARFREAINLIRTDLDPDFKINTTVQVFETTIRILGGLLSAHLYATDPSKKVYLGSEYDGFLLQRARNLADRLLPAYLTKTGLPLPRINLANAYHNVTPKILEENNAAAMACPMFEFTLLSYLTHDDKYQQVTRYAFDKVWAQRSELDLIPMSFSPHNQMAFNHYTGTGASIDSFYEYALKGAILFQDDQLWEVWQSSYYALRKHSKDDWFFANVDLSRGQVVYPWIDSLSAFFPGLQVLAGDVQDAQQKHLLFLKLWNNYAGIPERWVFQPQTADTLANISEVPLPWYPLRPEFVETTYFLYRATKDVFYLKVAWTILQDIKTFYRTKCGFAGLQDVTTGQLQDRMETFVLSETFKYLYLIFDVDNELHTDSSNVVFSTEAHPMWLRSSDFESYRSQKQFNDTLYRDHLTHCRHRDVAARKSSLDQFFEGISRYVFHRSEQPRINSSLEFETDADLVSMDQASCTISASNDIRSEFSYSHMLSEFDRLFEVDHLFAETLRKPTRFLDRGPMELEPDFYRLWCRNSKRNPKCRVLPTTESFEVIFELDSSFAKRRVPLNRYSSLANLTIANLAGIRMQIETLYDGAIDIYGELVEAQNIAHVPRENVYGAMTCPATVTGAVRSSVMVPTIYRATAVDGVPLALNATVRISSLPSFGKALTGILGVNSDNMLLLDDVPVMNVIFAV
ncbi:LANO_0B00606g1_1 [Lachancea nothofagi CBS 11611]|uniref:alpha-1,2-Mannosidase n=1 Tax=Lachancea nothofagi CBS 11611 TaxID=1266666 RepID=A0A1G4IUA4_9SACH|nr:LANO_0B00606g1_1 [Lachancea nothofagi CBS 11611]